MPDDVVTGVGKDPRAEANQRQAAAKRDNRNSQLRAQFPNIQPARNAQAGSRTPFPAADVSGLNGGVLNDGVYRPGTQTVSPVPVDWTAKQEDGPKLSCPAGAGNPKPGTKPEAAGNTDIYHPGCNTNITVNLTGVPPEMKDYARSKLDKILTDEAFKKSLGTRKLTINFASLGRAPNGAQYLGQSSIINNATGEWKQNVTVTFSTDVMSMENGKVLFAGKPFESVAVHEATHVRFPNLSGDSPNGHDKALGDYFFRAMTHCMERRLFGSTHFTEIEQRTRRWAELGDMADRGGVTPRYFENLQNIEAEVRRIAAMTDRDAAAIAARNLETRVTEAMNNAELKDPKLEPNPEPWYMGWKAKRYGVGSYK